MADVWVLALLLCVLSFLSLVVVLLLLFYFFFIALLVSVVDFSWWWWVGGWEGRKEEGLVGLPSFPSCYYYCCHLFSLISRIVYAACSTLHSISVFFLLFPAFTHPIPPFLFLLLRPSFELPFPFD